MATKTLTITRTFDAPVQRVWEAWTDPEQIKKWWGPAIFTVPAIKNDLRVGGKGHFCMRGPAGSDFDKDMWSLVVYKEIVPLQKIVWVDHFSDADGNIVSPKDFGMPGEWPEEMLVTITFKDLGDGRTELTLVHTGHPEEMAGFAEQGWNESLDKFAVVLR